MPASRQLPLAVAAHRLGKTYHQLRAMVLRRDLRGGQDDQGRWYADAAAVARLQRRHTIRGAGRGAEKWMPKE
jgi:hypothetical protein